MSDKIEYLEKYSVAPSPSRDYYGLRVQSDEVILYLWKISHGPHKIPLLRVTKFADFTQDKTLQEEIHRVFGEHLLKYVRKIAGGNRNTLLTLPKCLIKRLTKYLAVKDIVKLSSLSHIANEVFNDNSVWEILYKRYKPLKSKRNERVCNWKKILKQEHGEMFAGPKITRAASSKQAKPKTAKEEYARPASSTLRTISKVSSNMNLTMKKPGENSTKRPVQTPALKKFPDSGLERLEIEKKQLHTEKKVSTAKSLQLLHQKNMKHPPIQSVVSKTEVKRDIENRASIPNKSVELKSTKSLNKVQKTGIESRASASSAKISEDKSKLLKSKLAASRTKQEKLVSQSVENKSKTKSKTKKTGQSKSAILSTDKALLKDPSLIRNDRFDLADLIESSVKNTRSPRSIFDHDFSILEKLNSCSGDSVSRTEIRRNSQINRDMKISNHSRATLDRLSERSEPLTAKSIDSSKDSRKTPDVPSFTPKSMKSQPDKTKKSVNTKEGHLSRPTGNEKSEYLERYGIYNKYPSPRIFIGENEPMTSRKPIDKMELLRSLGSRDTGGITLNFEKDIRARNMLKSRGNLENVRKQRNT